MKTFPKLYKFNKDKSIQEWEIFVEDLGIYSSYSTIWGRENGAKQETTVFVEEGKNLGKSNETTPYEQACLEAQSKYNLQLDKGYNPGKPKKLANTSPMLAHPYEKKKKKVTFPCYYQPKLDGMRCVAHKENGSVTLYSRKGKIIDTLPHINLRLEALMDDGEIADGELYYKNTEFQTLLSWIKRNQKNSDKVQYHIYDMVMDKPFKERFARFCKMVGHDGKNIVRTVHTGKVVSHEDVEKVHGEQTLRGYEGIMLRIGDCTYLPGRRSAELLKVKSFKEKEYIIVDAKEGVGKASGQATFVCKTKNGKLFNVRPMGTDDEREEYWTNKNKYIGKELTVKFFELTNDGLPRFPVGKTIRSLVEG